jgi:hypothetical protein
MTAGLGLSTVRTIVGKVDGSDRTTRKRLERIEHRQQAIRALPKQVQRVVEEGRALLKEAKGWAADVA